MKIIALLILACTFSFGFGCGYVFNEFLNQPKIIHKPVNETPPVVSEKKQVIWF